MDGRPDGDARRMWSRHVGSMVRDPQLISHRQLKWKALSTDQLDSLWHAMMDPFENTDMSIDTFRETRMAHAKQIWDRWRSDLSREYVKIHHGDEAVVLANPPPCYDPSDWEFVCRHHFFTESFKKKTLSILTTENK
ncbi:uncharacterized protein LOC124918936 isoform X2 [Impatiens glandulifera]|uniref:uncharacterized protein LOC124918936 isoform X2 n=1 Tax=Impatiens glandulifera TaxID=253017 RepID=UPI001FB0F4AB|nr:uncharacterized protein LOC124918936 isoform X2 [Impatiens glandulifera]